jgi:hypothetical protein
MLTLSSIFTLGWSQPYPVRDKLVVKDRKMKEGQSGENRNFKREGYFLGQYQTGVYGAFCGDSCFRYRFRAFNFEFALIFDYFQASASFQH